GLDEGLALGVAVAATAMLDPEISEPGAEAAGGEGAAVVAAEAELAGLDGVHGDRAVDQGGCFLRACRKACHCLGRGTRSPRRINARRPSFEGCGPAPARARHGTAQPPSRARGESGASGRLTDQSLPVAWSSPAQ